MDTLVTSHAAMDGAGHSLPERSDIEAFCIRLKLAANPNRLQILLLLLNGEFAVGEIESRLGIKQPNLSQELRGLRESGLVQTRRQSKVVFYALAGREPARFVLALANMANQGNPRTGTGSENRRDQDPVRRAPPGTTGLRRDHGECGHFAVIHPPEQSDR